MLRKKHELNTEYNTEYKTMKIFINGQPTPVQKNQPMEEILTAFGATKPFAVLVNRKFVPASQLQHIRLHDFDHIEIISAIQGG